MPIIKDIEKKAGDVRTESLDMSFGELVNLHQNDELVISPEYQRLFRWSLEQRSRLIESILLKLPLPPLFVIEDEEGKYELIDGLQRLSSIIQFIDPEAIGEEALTLTGCDFVSSLNGASFDKLPLQLRLQIKRSSIRVNVITKYSKNELRYEMFKRLNTGGSLLSPQEIRNCSSRMAGDMGIKFYGFLKDSAAYPKFQTTISKLADAEREQKGDEELVLRYLALKHTEQQFAGSVRDWLDQFMDEVVLNKRYFDYENEEKDFKRLFDLIAYVFDDTAFTKYRNGESIGGLAPAYFEAVSAGLWEKIDDAESADPKELLSNVTAVLESPDFRSNTGPGANTKTKLRQRIQLISNAVPS